MRAPDSKQLDCFSEADWAAIKQSLADCGVELDATKVGEFVPGKRWWQADEQHSLDEQLDRIAWHYTRAPARKRPMTAAQVAEYWQTAAVALEKACDKFARFDHDNWYTTDDWATDARADEAITRYVEVLKKRVAERRAAPKPRTENARTRHNDYWRELTRLWRGITDNAGPLRRKKLGKFLVACTPPGLFPDMNNKAAIEKAIDGFFGNLNRQPHRPTSRRA
jgi:hypothetical protein